MASTSPQQVSAPTNQPITPQQPQGSSVPTRPTNGKAIAALVLGICSIPLSILGILAIIFGSLALGEIKRDGSEGKGMAIAGIVLGAIGLLLLVIITIGALAYFGTLSPAKLMPERTMFNNPLMNIDNALVKSDGTVAVPLMNNQGGTVTIMGVADVGDSGDCTTPSLQGMQKDSSAVALPAQVMNGERFILTWRCDALKKGEEFKADVGFTYTASGLERTHTGTIVSTVQ